MIAKGIYYKHSGAMPVAAILWMVVFGITTGIILGGIYAYALRYIPFIYVNFLLTAGFGIGLGVGIGIGSEKGHGRNLNITGLVAFLISIIALYVHWVIWLGAYGLGWSLDPQILWIKILLVNETGAWSIRNSDPVSGIALWIIWGIEAVIVIGITVFSARSASDGVYCENCREWVENETNFGPFSPVLDENEFRSSLERGDFESLKKLEVVDEGTVFSNATLNHCDGCVEMGTLTLNTVTAKENKKGETEIKTTPIVENLLVPSAARISLQDYWKAIEASAEEENELDSSDSVDRPDE